MTIFPNNSMSKKRNTISDFRGASRLAIDAVNGVVDIVEAMHANIAGLGGLFGSNKKKQTAGITGLVYKNIRAITGITGKSLDTLFTNLSAIVDEKEPTPRHEAILAALNGVIGDHLKSTKNPLAIPMKLRRDGMLIAQDDSLFRLSVGVKKKIMLLIHGLCMNDLQWKRNGDDYGSRFAIDDEFVPVYLHYNSGRHVSENGKELSDLLETTFDNIPGDKELFIVGHSMGGLVLRSAYFYGNQANHKWLKHLKKIVFLGTPHHGAPLEQIGNWVDTILSSNSYSAPLANLGKMRSAGVTDLRYGTILEEDHKTHDRFEPVGDRRTPVPLPLDINCYAIAAVINDASSKFGESIIGDGLVPLFSALGRHDNTALQLRFPENNTLILQGAKHLDLLSHPEIYSALKDWLSR